MRLLEAQHIPFEEHPLRSLQEVATTPQVFVGHERIGGYIDLARRLGLRPEQADMSYGRVLAAFASEALMSLALDQGLSGFIASPSACWRCTS